MYHNFSFKLYFLIFTLLFRRLLVKHRELCKEELAANNNLVLAVKQSKLIEAQKKSLLDMNNNAPKLGKQNHIICF